MNILPPDFEGVILDMPDADYRKAPGVSNSILKHISQSGDDVGSPAHFKANLARPMKDTDALFFGRMVHSRILTPDAALPNVEVAPDFYAAPADCDAVKKKKVAAGDLLPWHGASSYCKNWNFERVEKGIRVVTADEMESMNGVVNAIAKNPIAAMALASGAAEVSLFKQYWLDRSKPPILRKARLDWIPNGPALVDIKTTIDARKDEFSKSYFKFRYYVQAAYYLDLWNECNPDNQKTNFVFIAVEKKAPFALNVFDVTPRSMEAGRAEYRRNLHLLMACMETDSWPAYGDDVKSLDLPQWVYKKGAEDFA
jgi:hypothetical protein